MHCVISYSFSSVEDLTYISINPQIFEPQSTGDRDTVLDGLWQVVAEYICRHGRLL